MLGRQRQCCRANQNEGMCARNWRGRDAGASGTAMRCVQLAGRQAGGHMINAASPDLSSKTCGSLGGHMQLIGDESDA